MQSCKVIRTGYDVTIIKLLWTRN